MTVSALGEADNIQTSPWQAGHGDSDSEEVTLEQRPGGSEE